MSELSRVAPTGDDTADEMAAAVRNWGLARVRPQIRELELAGEFPRALYREMGAARSWSCSVALG
jgi:regulator of protease activity HflC (stomatin/prohibitin superfamily)